MPLRFTHRSTATLAATIAASLVLTGVSVAASTAATGDRSTVIVEFDGAAAVTRLPEGRATELRGDEATRSMKEDYRAVVAQLESEQNAVVSAARDAGVALGDVRHVTSVLNAVVATVDEGRLAELRATPGVARVTLDTEFHAVGTSTPAPEPTASSTSTTTPSPTAEPEPAPPVPAEPEPASPVPAEPEPAPVVEPTPQTVPLPGAGVTVAIIDTGIDYTHPELGGAFGEGHLVVDGYDFVNDDADPMDDHYHGTHVAGIVAGSTTGVAPGVELTAYKVLDGTGSGQLSAVVLGIDAAANPAGDHPADVINMSLGGPGDGTDPVSVAAGNAIASGALVVAAAGNAGPGEGTIGAPAAAPQVLSVGASITDFRAPTLSLTAPNPAPIVAATLAYSANGPATPVTARIVDVGTGSEEDLAAAGSVRGAIVVFDGTDAQGRFESPLASAQRAEAHGAVAALLYERNDLDESAGGGDGPVLMADSAIDVPASPPTALASGDDGRLDRLVAFSIADSAYALFAADVVAGTATATVASIDGTDRIASFSSRGPTTRGALKPEVVAPGYMIRSTVPLAQGVADDSYRLSGTSMAAPFVAGTAAVLAARHPDFDPATLRNALVGSAAPLESLSRDASPTTQGAGRIRLDTALRASVVSEPSTLGFGQADARKPAETAKFTLTNTGTVSVSGTITVQASASSEGTLTVSAPSVTIAPGEHATISATAKADVAGGVSELSGQIVATLDDGSTVRIPYLQLDRKLNVTSTPNPSTGLAAIFVDSFLPLDKPPVLTITPQKGKPFTVPTVASDTMPGSYTAEVSEKRIGVYAVTASATTAKKTLLGTGGFEIVASATDDSTWQQVGRNGNSARLAVSTRQPGTAMQISLSTHRPFVTTDYGKTWTHLQSVPVANGEGDILADPTKGKGFWYFINSSAGRFVVDPSYTAKLFRTDDLGKTWKALPLPATTVYAVANEGTRLAAVTDGGAEVSRDGGKSFGHIVGGWGKDVSSAALFRGDLYVTSPAGLWKVPSAFGRAGAAELVTTSLSHFTSVSAGDDFVAVAGLGGIAVSTDGRAWKDTAFDKELWGYGLSVVGDRIYVGDLQSTVYRSTNAGKSWTAQASPVRGGIPEQFAAWPGVKRSLLVVVPTAGLYSSKDDGAAYTRIGVAATSIRTVIASTDSGGEPTVFVADDLGVGSAPLPGRAKLPAGVTEWGAAGTEARVNVDSVDVAQDAVDHDTLWKTQYSSGRTRIMTSTDAGAQWAEAGPPNAIDVADIAASPTVGGHVAASVKGAMMFGLVVTRDAWATWETYSHSIVIRRITIDPHDDNRMWLAADEGLYVSNDDGRTITRVLEAETDTVWVDPADADHVVAGGRGLWASHDGGASFAASDAGGADMYVTSVTSATVKGKRGKETTVFFAGTTDFRPGPLWVGARGVLASVDHGDTWHNVTAGIGTAQVSSLDASDDGKWLLAGTRGGGVYRAGVAELVSRLK